MAAHMQARMQHQQQQGNSQQMPNPQLGPFGGPGSFPFCGEIMCSKLSQFAPKPLVTWNSTHIYLDAGYLMELPSKASSSELRSNLCGCPRRGSLGAGMPGPNFPMSNPFWPQMGSGMPGGNQGPRPPLYPGGGNNGQFDPVSAAYYATLGNQQMAAAMAAAAVSFALELCL